MHPHPVELHGLESLQYRWLAHAEGGGRRLEGHPPLGYVRRLESAHILVGDLDSPRGTRSDLVPLEKPGFDPTDHCRVSDTQEVTGLLRGVDVVPSLGQTWPRSYGVGVA